MTITLSDGVPFHNGFGPPSKEMYCKREVVEMILIATPSGLKGEHLFKVTPSGNPLSSESKGRENF